MRLLEQDRSEIESGDRIMADALIGLAEKPEGLVVPALLLVQQAQVMQGVGMRRVVLESGRQARRGPLHIAPLELAFGLQEKLGDLLVDLGRSLAGHDIDGCV